MERLTKKQRGFVKDYIETGNGQESALNNYDTEDLNTARAIASENLTKPNIQNAIAEALPDELLSKKHLQFLNSKREEIGIKALDMGYKVKGLYAPEKLVSLNLNGDIIANEELQVLAKQLNEIARNNNRANIESDGTTSDTLDSET